MFTKLYVYDILIKTIVSGYIVGGFGGESCCGYFEKNPSLCDFYGISDTGNICIAFFS